MAKTTQRPTDASSTVTNRVRSFIHPPLGRNQGRQRRKERDDHIGRDQHRHPNPHEF